METGLAGWVGRAYGFDGESSYALAPSMDTLNPGDRDVRITLWIKTSDKPERPDWDLVKKGYAPESPGYYKVEYQPDGRVSCGFAGTKGSQQVTGGPDLADGNWHHVSCTKTATSIALSVDGQPVASEETTIGEIANSDDLVLGAYRGPTHSGHFPGAMDQVVRPVAPAARAVRTASATSRAAPRAEFADPSAAEPPRSAAGRSGCSPWPAAS